MSEEGEAARVPDGGAAAGRRRLHRPRAPVEPRADGVAHPRVLPEGVHRVLPTRAAAE